MNILTNDIIREEFREDIKHANKFYKLVAIGYYIFIGLLGVALFIIFGREVLVAKIMGVLIIVASFILCLLELLKKKDINYIEEGYWKCVVADVINKDQKKDSGILYFTMKVKDMTFDIDCRNVQEYNKMRIGDQVFLIIEEHFSFIENLYNMKAVKYYTIDQYYRYENKGTKSCINKDNIVKGKLTDFDLYGEISKHESSKSVAIVCIAFLMLIFISFIIFEMLRGNYSVIIPFVLPSFTIFSVAFATYKFNRRKKGTFDKEYKKKYVLVDNNNGVYSLIRNDKNDIKLICEFSKNKYEYVGTKYKDDSNIFEK